MRAAWAVAASLYTAVVGVSGSAAWADPQVPPPAVNVVRTVLLDGETVSDQFAARYVKELENNGIRDVDLWHVGREIPDELKILARWISSPRYLPEKLPNGKTYVRREQIQVHFHRVEPEQFEAQVLATQAALVSETADLAVEARYKGGAPIQPEEAAWKQEFEQGVWKSISTQLRHFFGIPRGISFAVYRVKRDWQQVMLEGGGTLARLPVTSWVLYLSLQSKIAEGKDINIVAPIAVAGTVGAVLDYFARGNSDFQRQGIHFDFDSKNPYDSLAFFGATQLVHSLLLRQAIMAATHGTDLTLGDMGDAASTTGRGWVAKLYPERFAAWLRKWAERTHDRSGRLLTSRQRKVREWISIAWLQIWRTCYPSLNIADMFGFGNLPKQILTAGAAFGGSLELTLRSGALAAGARRQLRKWNGTFDTSENRTLIVPRRPSGGDADLPVICGTLLSDPAGDKEEGP